MARPLKRDTQDLGNGVVLRANQQFTRVKGRHWMAFYGGLEDKDLIGEYKSWQETTYERPEIRNADGELVRNYGRGGAKYPARSFRESWLDHTLFPDEDPLGAEAPNRERSVRLWKQQLRTLPHPKLRRLRRS